MSSKNKKFAYAAGDEDNTDSFISSTIASAPKNAHNEEMELQTGNFAGRDGSYYSVDTGREKEFRNKCANGVVYAFSVLLLLVAIGLFIGAAMQDKNPSFIAFCPDCKTVISATFGIAGCILVIAGLGLVSARSRSACWACLFVVGLVLLTCLFIAVGIGFFVIQGGTHLDDYWKDYVTKKDNSFICNIQTSLSCSGWDFCCWNQTSGVTTTTTTTPPATTTSANGTTTTTSSAAFDRWALLLDATTAAPPALPTCSAIDWATQAAAAQATCLDACYSDAPPCKDVLKAKMKDLTVPVAIVSFPLGVLCALVAWASKRMLAKEE